jgi:hypothetical protein
MQLERLSERRSLVDRIGRFFYAEEVPYGIAVVRMMMPLALLATMSHRWQHAREMYSLDGAATPLWNGYGWPNLLPEPSGTLAVVFMTVLLFALATTAIGWCTRASTLLCFVLYTYLTLLDATGTMTKYSVIATHVFLLLSLSNCGAVWSVDAWLKRRREVRPAGLPGFAPPTSPAWPRRLIQLLIGFVYFGAAMTKLHTPAFFNGEQLLAWMKTNLNNDNPFGEYLTQHPSLIVATAYITVVWEIVFVFTAWRGVGRTVMLFLGVVFHVMTALTLGLFIFPVVCVAIYFAFMNEDDVRNLTLFWRRLRNRLGLRRKRRNTATRLGGWIDRSPVPSPAAFGIAVALIALAGVEVEHWMDPYGKRRPEGPYTLTEIDRSYVERVLHSPPEEVHPEDIIAEVEAGTVLIGGSLANHRRDFRLGETVVVQCRLNLPHKDMWLECDLRDSENYTIASHPQPVTRETQRVTFPPIPLNSDFTPGRYAVVVKAKGREIRRYSFTLHPPRRTAAAN